jgi:RHS repeat-associated protein
VDNGQLKITASNTASIEKQVVAEPGMVYELVFDMDAGTFSDLKIDVLESVASGKPVNTSYTTIRNGKHTIYFKAATNEIFLRFTPQTNLTGSRNAYINYITLRRVSSRPAPGSIVYTENMTLTNRTSNTPSTYTASNSITFDSGFESGAGDEFQTFVEPTVFVSDGMERDDYRFGFNGKEKDDETYGVGNMLDYDARLYGMRLGQFLSCDPAAKKYPFMSPYAAFGNNPIFFKDNGGRTLEPGGNISLTMRDLRSLVPKEYQSQIQVNSAGKIEFQNYDKLPDAVQNYEGVKLLNDLISSSSSYKYSVSNETKARIRESGKTGVMDLNLEAAKTQPWEAIANFSKTPRSDEPQDYLPEEGFDGAVTIAEGEFFNSNPMTGTGKFPINRANIVFHELKESYLRTDEKKDYVGKDGAHSGANKVGSKFSEELSGKKDLNPGTVSEFEPKN